MEFFTLSNALSMASIMVTKSNWTTLLPVAPIELDNLWIMMVKLKLELWSIRCTKILLGHVTRFEPQPHLRQMLVIRLVTQSPSIRMKMDAFEKMKMYIWVGLLRNWLGFLEIGLLDS